MDLNPFSRLYQVTLVSGVVRIRRAKDGTEVHLSGNDAIDFIGAYNRIGDIESDTQCFLAFDHMAGLHFPDVVMPQH